VKPRELRELMRAAAIARGRTGRSVVSQLADIARLRLSRHGIQPLEYYDLGLYEKPRDDQRRYVGYWVKDRVYRVQDPQWLAVGNDKLLTYVVLEGLGLPYPRVVAVCHPTRFHPGARLLRSAEEAARYLREEAPYPFFSKPAVSYLGYDNYLVRGLDRDADRLLFADGTSMPVDEFAGRYAALPKGPTIFQELIRPHPKVAEVIGDRVATVRLMILNLPEGPQPYRAALRIPVGASMVDNFRRGAAGNMFGEIEFETGRIARVVADIGLDYQTADRHPDTGVSFDGFALPDWPAALDIATRASAAMPGLRVHSWDIAFSDRGPLLVETNPRGDFHLIQHAHRSGLAQEPFLSLYAADGGRI
jgi:hypothetical protein